MTEQTESIAQPETMNIGEILKLLPHRYPFLLVDRVVELVPGKYIKAYKNLTFNEPFFQGHFPGVPVMPGVLILEAMAQTGGLMVVRTAVEDPTNKLFLFTGLENVRFRRPVYPGDRLDMVCTLVRHKLKLWKTDCKAYVDGVLVAEGLLTAAVTDKEGL